MQLDLYKYCRIPAVVDVAELTVSPSHWTYELTGITRHIINKLTGYFLNAVVIFSETVYVTAWLRRTNDSPDYPVRLKVVILNPYYIGVEYPRTKPIVSKDYPRVLEVVSGEAIVLMYPQELVRYNGNLVREDMIAYAARLGQGERVVIPPDWVFNVVNIGKDPLVFVEFHNARQPKNVIERYKRLPPFLFVVKNEKVETAKNPRYRYVSKYVWIDGNKVVESLGFHKKGSVISQCLMYEAERYPWIWERKSVNFLDIFTRAQINSDEYGS